MAEKDKGFLAGFKAFILRGNAIDLAVGVVIGAAFTAIINALVEKVLNPLVGALFGKPNFDSVLSVTVGTGDHQAQIIFGAVITALVNFLLVALTLYLCVVLPMNKLHEWQESRKPSPSKENSSPTTTELLVEIRDLLAAK